MQEVLFHIIRSSLDARLLSRLLQRSGIIATSSRRCLCACPEYPKYSENVLISNELHGLLQQVQ